MGFHRKKFDKSKREKNFFKRTKPLKGTKRRDETLSQELKKEADIRGISESNGDE